MVASAQINEWVRMLAELAQSSAEWRETALYRRRKLFRGMRHNYNGRQHRRYEKARTEWLSCRSCMRELERKIAAARGEV